MQGMILAAGMGKRLKSLTEHNTKCMVKVNGITLIERMLRILDKKHLSRIVIVVGYEGKKLIDFIGTLKINTPICYIDNNIYYKTNNIYSLSLAKEYLCSEDTLLLESDLIFQEEIIDLLLKDERKNLALVDKFESWMDGTCMVLDEEDCITDFIPGKYLNFLEKEKYYKTVNIYKFSKEFSENTYVPFLSAYEKAMGDNEYYESVIKLISLLETKEIRAKRLSGQEWYEIDDIQDLNIAESLFATTEERYEKVISRFGGYWRYPHLLDFCYLVNPYFPSKKLIEEIKSNFEMLLMQYPSGMQVNSLLAANNFGVKPEHIVVGNGAAELIKSFMEHIQGNIGIIRPTFEEYANRCERDRVISFFSSREDFHYGVEEIIDFFNTKDIEVLVLINPDNPSGNYIEQKDLVNLLQWAENKGVKLLIDESFVDFVKLEDGQNITEKSLIHEKILEKNEKLYVVKSISKSYGVPGIRLGVLASADDEMIQRIKSDVAIWNINSFAEFYMQNMAKYSEQYEKALQAFRECRDIFASQLRKISFLDVYDTQANFFMCKVKGIESRELCQKLLKDNILIKDLSGKIADGKHYVRIAIRKQEENDRLINALKNLEK